MADTPNLMSPSLAGIVSDPDDASRRIVPSSQRADGSTRKERKVRPGHVPAEDVAKYRPGQGSLRAQHAAAQATHQAPPSPSPAPASPIRRPNPSDFLTDRQSKEPALIPPPSPTKPSRSGGASSSRWASAPSEPTPGPAPAPAIPSSPRLGSNKPQHRSRGGGPRKGKAPALQQPSSAETDEQRSTASAAEQEAAKENVQPSPPFIPSTPESKIPDLPETPGGDWWADEDDDDDEVDAAAQALQGFSIKDAASRQKAGSPTPPSTKRATRPVQQQASTSTSKLDSANGQKPREGHPKNVKKPQQHSSKSSNGSRSGSSDLLSRLGPPVPSQAPRAASLSSAAPLIGVTSKLTVEEIRAKAKSLSQEIRQSNQLSKYGEAGAVLSDEQSRQIEKSQNLLQELNSLKAVTDNLAAELSRLVEACQP